MIFFLFLKFQLQRVYRCLFTQHCHENTLEHELGGLYSVIHGVIHTHLIIFYLLLFVFRKE